MLTDNEQRRLYVSLLRGMANDIRNAPGSCDLIGHEWSPWVRSEVRHDDDGLPRFHEGPMVPDTVVRIRADRHCYQCGKEQVDL